MTFQFKNSKFEIKSHERNVSYFIELGDSYYFKATGFYSILI